MVEIEILKSGEVTWVDRLARETKGYMREGDRHWVKIKKCKFTGHYILTQGKLDILMPVENFKLV